MEHKLKSLTTDCMKRAVEQYDRIESSLDRCLRVLHEGDVPHLPKLAETEAEVLLDPKEGYMFCEGQKPADLFGMDDHLSDGVKIRNLAKCAKMKMEQVLSSQERIFQRLHAIHGGLLTEIDGPQKDSE